MEKVYNTKTSFRQEFVESLISWNLERGLMIHFLLLQNRQGQTRLSRWYVPVKAEEKGKIESEVHRMITSRPSKFSNFINVRFLSL